MESMNVNHLDQVTKSITPSGFFGTSKDNIIELENFMTEEEIDFLEKSAKAITIWDVTESHVNENGTTIYDADYWKDIIGAEGDFTLTEEKED